MVQGALISTRVVRVAVRLVVPVLISCVSSAGGQARGVHPRKVDRLVVIGSDGSQHLAWLDSPRVDSLRQTGVMLEQNVDEHPEILSGPQIKYPHLARRQCVTGRVIVQVIVGPDGRAEASSLGVRQSVEPSIDRAALDYMSQASFKPGKVHGVAVRTLVNIPVDFKIRGAC